MGPRGTGLTAESESVNEQAVLAYAQVVGLRVDTDVDQELLAETIELLDALKLLAAEDLGRLGMAVDFSLDP
jgi:hypothetical protein